MIYLYVENVYLTGTQLISRPLPQVAEQTPHA